MKMGKDFKTKLFFGLFCCLIVGISFHCIESPLDPVAPASQITMQQIPLIDITKYIRDVQGKTPGVTTDSITGDITYRATQYSAPKGINSIALKMQSSGQQVGVGVFSIASIPTTNSGATLAQMGLSPIDYPGANSTLPGVPPPFPANYISIPGDTLNYSSQFDYVAINSGSLTLQFTNNLPLKIDFNHPLVLRNNQFHPFVDTSWIAVFNFGSVDSFATEPLTEPLNGKILRAQMKFDSVSFTTEQRSSSFSLKSSNGLSTQFSSTALTADSAAAVIPSQQMISRNDSSVIVDDTVVVKSAAFSAGSFQLQLKNNVGIEVGVHFVVNELLLNNSSFTIDTILQGYTTATWTINGNHFNIQTNPLPSQLGTNLTFSVGIKTIDSKGVKQPITKNDFVRASIIPISPLVVESVTGKIKPQIIPINLGIKSGFSDISNIKAKITFDYDSLIARFLMTGGFPMDYNLTVFSKLNGNVLSTFSIATDNITFKRIYPGNFIIPISKAPGFNNFLSNSFPNVPDSFYVVGSVTLDPQDEFTNSNYYTIYDTTKIYPALDVKLPFGAGVQNGIITQMTSFGKDVIPKDFTKAVVNGSITFTVINAIPIQLAFQSRLIRYDTTGNGVHVDTLLYLPQVSRDSSYTILPAQYNTVNQIVTAPYRTTFTVALNSTDMQNFNQADSMLVRFVINTSNNGSYAKVRSTDSIRVFASGNINYIINKP